jgi:exodeoxyribonuclease VII small subunit
MKNTFEEAMTRLEEIAGLLEAGEASLEETIKIYEEGIKLIDFCQKKLNEAEKKVQKLTKNEAGEFEETPLDATENNGDDSN